MKAESELISAIIAGLALLVSLWSIILSRKTIRKEKLNDFYNRRNEMLYKIIESRVLINEGNSIEAELKRKRDELIKEIDPNKLEGLNQHRNTLSDSDFIKILDNLEKTIKDLIPSTPIDVLQNAAAEVHKIYLLTKHAVDEIKNLKNNIESKS
jgi:hypothetical protein